MLQKRDADVRASPSASYLAKPTCMVRSVDVGGQATDSITLPKPSVPSPAAQFAGLVP